MPRANDTSTQLVRRWLPTYYFLRAGVSAAWIALAVLVGKNTPAVSAALLVAYPAWDAIANYIDAQKVGGLRLNRSQMLNFFVSVITAIAVAFALTKGMSAILLVFGAWAFIAGVLQLVTGVRRWELGGQWAMVLSGGQSALVSLFFFKKAASASALDPIAVAGYATLGAVYFLISAIWLTVKNARLRRSRRDAMLQGQDVETIPAEAQSASKRTSSLSM